MSGGWPLGPKLADFTSAVNLGDSDGITVNSGSGIDSYGPFTTLVSAMPSDCDAVLITTAAASYGFLDIAIGAAGSEEVIVPALRVQCGSPPVIGTLTLPLKLAAGVRVSARFAADSPPSSCTVALAAAGSDFIEAPFSSVTKIAAEVPITPSGSPNTKGPWTQVVASAPADFLALLIIAGRGAPITVQNSLLMDIGVGPSGAETVILPNLKFATWDTVQPHYYGPFRKPIKSGTRIAARMQWSSSSYATALSLYGMN